MKIFIGARFTFILLLLLVLVSVVIVNVLAQEDTITGSAALDLPSTETDNASSITGSATLEAPPPDNEETTISNTDVDTTDTSTEVVVDETGTGEENKTATETDAVVSYDQGTLMNAINDLSEEEFEENGLSLFRQALIAVDLLDQVLGVVGEGTYTVFAPTNAAIKANRFFMHYMKGIDDLPASRWYEHLKAALHHHMIPNEELNDAALFDSSRSFLQTMLTPETNSTIKISQFSKTLGGAKLVPDKSKYNIQTTNGILHVVTQVISPEFMSQPFGMLELQVEYGPDPLGRVSLVDVVEVDDARDILNTIHEDGLTFAGCRIRAFNRLEEYLPQTINDSLNVTYGELVNASFVNETRVNLFEYSLIPKNYYFDDIEDGFVELVTPVSGDSCNGANMWVTKQEGVLCFNNGCTIETPNLRKYFASNGIGYVVDKCQVCHGTAMLVNVAAEYTGGLYNLRDTAQFFVASGWNLRDLRLSVGDGTDITMFAPINSGWEVFNLEDITRLAGEEWHPHKLDLLKHFMVQGRFTYNDLFARYQQNGPFNLTMLTGEPVLVDYKPDEKMITIAGGDLFYKDIQGVDGLVHFTSEVPMPISVNDSVYEYGQKLEKFKTQVTLIDAVYLAADLKRLLPITVLYSPNPTWDNKKIAYDEISKSVLENMIFKSLLWCDKLREMSGLYVESHNEKYWSISVNDKNMPCFEFKDGADGATSATMRSCVTKCDVLVRNGIVHEVDNVLLFEVPETFPPQDPNAQRLPGMGSDNYDNIMSSIEQDKKASTSGGTGSAGGISTSTGDSGFQRPKPTQDDIVGQSSAIASSLSSITLVMSIVTIVFSMIVLTV